MGAAGRVIGVDMTPEMLAKARVINLSPDKAQVFAEVEAMLHQAGFSAVSVEIKEESRAFPKAVASLNQAVSVGTTNIPADTCPAAAFTENSCNAHQTLLFPV